MGFRMFKNTIAVLLVLTIPFFLFFAVLQGMEYSALEAEVRQLEAEQYEVIEMNRRFISGITVLSSPGRIEKLAVEDLGMRKAETGEIMRIEMRQDNDGA